MKVNYFVLCTLLNLFYISALPNNKLTKRMRDIAEWIEDQGIQTRM